MVPDLSELRGFHLDKRRTTELRQSPRYFSLAAACRADHQYVLGSHFGALLLGELQATPASAQSHGNCSLGIGLPNYELVKFGAELGRS
jgi:hypothetical protein